MVASPGCVIPREPIHRSRAAIEGGATRVTLPFQLLNNHIDTSGTVNGKGPYTFIVDTGGHTLISPRLLAEADAGAFDRSGMWINAEAQGYVVTDVTHGGPADEAGIKVGDIITTLDGSPVRFEALSDTRLLFRTRPAGTKVPLELKRAGVNRKTTLTLADQI